MFMRLAPDFGAAQVALIAPTLQRQSLDGVVATNTALSRQAVQNLPHANEAGVLSDKPQFETTNRVIAQLRIALGPGLPIISVGGVMIGADAVAKAAAGRRPDAD
jgi:dihydroorotate dehydrogenase